MIPIIIVKFMSNKSSLTSFTQQNNNNTINEKYD